MTRYRCVLFDLDHTLWDYNTNCSDTLQDLHVRYDLARLGITSYDSFLSSFHEINNEMWDSYDRGLLPKDAIRNERFHRVLKKEGIDDLDMSLRLSHDYISESPFRKKLIPDAMEILEYLQPKYSLFIITNGFDEIQTTKLESSGIRQFFNKIITSEMAGHKKPAKQIFEYALSSNGFQSHEAVMIGDNLLTDIAGARNAGVDSVYFNPNRIAHDQLVTHEIHGLDELRRIL